ncbi:DUF6958 family protein [Haladaptatus sp. GCM10025707]|uniref:DUF6958 family protein n=1 Tax=unclassified Haladaptatus TaxID=2622732 RepID=UPI0023E83415|nr:MULTISPECIES: hypothetical protein [unclassified Haladaptatus]
MHQPISTQYPDFDRDDASIDDEKYGAVRDAIKACLGEHGALTFAELVDDVDAHIGEAFDGSVLWFVTRVKLDLENEDVIERVTGTTPQQLRLVG